MTITCYPTRCPATRAANPTRVTRVRVARSGRVGCMNWHPDPTQTGHYRWMAARTQKTSNLARFWGWEGSGGRRRIRTLKRVFMLVFGVVVADGRWPEPPKTSAIARVWGWEGSGGRRSEEHTSELQS